MVQENNIEAVQALLEAGADPNIPAKGHYRSITVAVEKNNLDTAQLLIAHGASVEQEDYDDPLVAAVKQDNIKMVELIVRHRKKINPDYGYTLPLELAWGKNAHPRILGILRKAGAKLSY